MKKRIMTGWTWMRGALLFIGMWMIIQTALEGQWIGIFLGSWLAIMGLFGLGCAAGNCFNSSCEVNNENGTQNQTK